jgi:hypothetical protein
MSLASFGLAIDAPITARALSPVREFVGAAGMAAVAG